MALIRYPGSKEKLAEEIGDAFPAEILLPLVSSSARWEYREPFFGAGAVGFLSLEHLDPNVRVWLNDIDPGIVALWQSVLKSPVALCRMIQEFRPTKEAFYCFKDEDGRKDLPELERGFRKLALHRLSYSGLGAMAGGPIGGRIQKSNYNVDCRWKPERMKRDIGILHRRLSRFQDIQITNGDFAPLIQDAPKKCFIYLDPPYYEKGGQLYKHSMSEVDHQRLHDLLAKCEAAWALSYDDHPEIRRLYSWAEFRDMHLTYTISNKKCETRPKNREVVIVPKAA
jgi:DNA adenine methylase